MSFWRAKRSEAMWRWLGILAMIMLGVGWSPRVAADMVEYGDLNVITIPSLGDATPYPSQIVVDNVPGLITQVTVTIRDFEHTRPSDVDILLVGPDGSTNVVLMAKVGDNTVTDDIWIHLTEDAGTLIPCANGPLPVGPPATDFRATNCGADDFPAPAPPRGAGYGETMTVFNGQSPNGTWRLFVTDPLNDNSGSINGGWVLNITTDAPLGARVVAFGGTHYDGRHVQLHWQTNAEVDNLGFHVYRDVGGVRQLITPGLVAGSALQMKAASPSADWSYAWTDTLDEGIGAVQYWLEDVDLHGKRRQHGPIVPRMTSGPAPSVARAALLSQVGRNPPALHAAQGTRITPLRPRQAANQAMQHTLAAGPAVKVAICDDGWYRVSQEELVAAGLDPSTAPEELQLYLHGREEPIQVHHAVSGQFNAGDFIEFYGQKQDTSSTGCHTYWLVAGQAGGERVSVLESSAEPGGAESFLATVERRDKSIYFAGLTNGAADNFFGPAILSEPLEQTIVLTAIDPDPPGVATLEVAAQGVGDVTDTDPDHLIQVWVNGVAVGQLVYDGQTWKRGAFTFAQSVLHEGDNSVTLQSQGGTTDVSLLDYLRLSYWQTYTAEADQLLCTVGPDSAGRRGQSVQTIDGFKNPNIRVFDITPLAKVSELAGSVEPGNGYAVTVQALGPAPRTILAMTEEQIKTPSSLSPNVPSQWHAGKHSADLVIVSHAAFAGPVQSLVEARQAEGLQVVVADVQDLYDEFNYGEPSYLAVQAFLRLAWESWERKPRFVLLVGNSTYDGRDYLGHGAVDYVPTMLVDTTFMETASDDGLVDFNGDGIPEMAIGRLPVRTVEMAARVIGKLVNYSRQGGDAAGQRALLVADIPTGYNFEEFNAQLRRQLPASMAVTEVRRQETGDAAAQQLVQEQINAGVSLVSYSGHGNSVAWRGDLLTAASAEALVNGDKLPVVAAMSCLNAYFLDPVQESLAEALLQAEAGGAMAVLASSGMTYGAGQAQVLESWIQLLFAGGNGDARPTLGEALTQAKAATTDRDVRRTLSLLGDPSMRLAK
jgi:subtilisin-like proprotein convertase family protein